MRADPLALQCVQMGRAARVAGTGWAEGGSAPAEMQGVQRWGRGEWGRGSGMGVPARDHTLKTASYIQHPSHSSSRSHQTFPEVYPNLVGTLLPPHARGKLFKDSTLNGTCIPAMELSEP